MTKIMDELRTETIELLSSLIGIRSENPPGSEDGIPEFIERYLADRDIDSERVPLENGRSSIVSRIAGRLPGSYVLCGHIDTVPAEGSQWTTNPFFAHREGRYLRGLGAADMKSGVAVLIALACDIKKRALALSHDIVLALTADEEGSYRGATSVASSGLIDDARFLLIAEPTGGAVYLGQRGELWVEATFRGRAAHGSTPSSGINAILPASEFCLRLADESRSFPEIPGLGRTSLNVGLIEGGRRVNIVPDTATVHLDSRAVTTAERERVLLRIREAGSELSEKWGAQFSYEIYNDRAPILSDPKAPEIVRFLEVNHDLTGRPIRPEIAPYSTDAVAIVPQTSIPLIIYGPGSIEQAHRPDEYVDLDALFEVMEVIGSFLVPR